MAREAKVVQGPPPNPVYQPPQRTLLEEFRDLLAARRRRKQEKPWEFYRPLKKLAAFHVSKARVKAIIAANRAGKTEAHVGQAVRRALGQDPHRPDFPVPNHGWIISVSNEAQREILQPKFERYLPASYLQNIVYRQRRVWDQLILPNGSIIGFKSCEMDRKVFQGAALHWASFDEEPDPDIYEEVMTRLTDYKGDAWLTFTPINGMTWTYDMFVDPQTKNKDSEVFEASMWDNAKSNGGYLDDDEIRRFEDSIKDPIMKRIRVYGEYHSQVGRIYKSFDRNIHGIDRLPAQLLAADGTINSQFDTYVRIDTGRRFAATFYVVDYFGNIFLFDEFFDESDGREGTINSRARTIRNMCTRWDINPEFKVDPSSQFVIDLSEAEINASLANSDVLKGIDAVQDYMAVNMSRSRGPQYLNPKFYVVKDRCPRFLFEVQRYSWDTPAASGSAAGEKKNQPRKKDDHVMDTVRYMCVDKPPASRPPEGEDNRPIQQRIMEYVKKRTQERGQEKRDDTFGDGIDVY
jgi:phage terminase large subunit-like protein